MNKLRALKEKRQQIINKSPSLKKILRSTISKYYLTCGYKKCWCHKGKKKHGPFIYLSHSEKGRTKMHFVPKELIKDVQEKVGNYKRLHEIIYKLCKINREILWLEKKNTYEFLSEEIKNMIRHSHWVCAEETGWKVNSENWQL